MDAVNRSPVFAARRDHAIAAPLLTLLTFDLVSLAVYRAFVLPSNPLLILVLLIATPLAWSTSRAGRWLTIYMVPLSGVLCPWMLFDFVGNNHGLRLPDHGLTAFGVHGVVHAVCYVWLALAWYRNHASERSDMVKRGE